MIEVLVCVGVLAVLVGLLLPAFAKARTPQRFNCISNQKLIGLACRLWANDHGEKFPWEVTSVTGGTKEFVGTTEGWRHFQAISNEVNIPKVFVCSKDKERTSVRWWDSFTDNSHLSYFVGLDADETKPQTTLSGDRNLAVSNKLLRGEVSLTTKMNLEWTTTIHNKSGYIGLSDGSVSQATTQILNKQLQAAFLSTTQATLRFVFPQ